MSEHDMTTDFEPAARALRELLPMVADDRLAAPTPCAGWSVADLLDHLMGLTVAFRMAAEKTSDAATGGGDRPSPTNLDPQWRERLPERLDRLVAAWRKPDAWTGETAAGGVVLPAGMIGIFGLDELIVHGWDLARATGQPYDPDPASVAVVHELVAQQASDAGTPGLFGPKLDLPADAPLLDRLIGLTGRDPAWKPGPTVSHTGR